MLLAVVLLLAALWLAVVALLPPPAHGPINSFQASRLVGETRTVCGFVIHARYVSHARGAPTFLNLDLPHPVHVFTVVIWGEDRRLFPTAPECFYWFERICATGAISAYQGRAQIVVRRPSQIAVANNWLGL